MYRPIRRRRAQRHKHEPWGAFIGAGIERALFELAAKIRSRLRPYSDALRGNREGIIHSFQKTRFPQRDKLRTRGLVWGMKAVPGKKKMGGKRRKDEKKEPAREGEEKSKDKGRTYNDIHFVRGPNGPN